MKLRHWRSIASDKFAENALAGVAITHNLDKQTGHFRHRNGIQACHRPATFGQAARIQGVTPADLAVVSIWVKNSGGKK